MILVAASAPDPDSFESKPCRYLMCHNSGVAEYLANFVDPREVMQFDESNWVHGLMHLAVPNFAPLPPIEVGTLYWPSDASRFSVGYFLVDDDDLRFINPIAFSKNGPVPIYLQIDEQTTAESRFSFTAPTTQANIGAMVYCLPPRPLAQCLNLTGKEITLSNGKKIQPNAPVANELWLLTVVDERYFYWQVGSEINAGSWTGFYDAIFSELQGANLASNATADPVDTAYPVPSNRYVSEYQPLPMLMDAGAYQSGLRFCRHIGVDGFSSNTNAGILQAQEFSTAILADAESQALLKNGGLANAKTGDFIPLAGGLFNSDLIAESVSIPEFFQIVFPVQNVDTTYAAGPYVIDVPLAGLGDTTTDPPTAGAITNATNATPIVVTSAGHGLTTGDTVVIWGVTGNTAANRTWIITVTSSSAFSLNTSVGSGSYVASGWWGTGLSEFQYSDSNNQTIKIKGLPGQSATWIADSVAATSTPTNLVTLEAYAQAAACDWYKWQLGNIDQVIGGIAAYDSNALIDSIKWTYTTGMCCTRIQRRKWNDRSIGMYRQSDNPGYQSAISSSSIDCTTVNNCIVYNKSISFVELVCATAQDLTFTTTGGFVTDILLDGSSILGDTTPILTALSEQRNTVTLPSGSDVGTSFCNYATTETCCVSCGPCEAMPNQWSAVVTGFSGLSTDCNGGSAPCGLIDNIYTLVSVSGVPCFIGASCCFCPEGGAITICGGGTFWVGTTVSICFGLTGLGDQWQCTISFNIPLADPQQFTGFIPVADFNCFAENTFILEDAAGFCSPTSTITVVITPA